jgi:hypothetical protein
MRHRTLASVLLAAFVAACGGDGKVTAPERPRIAVSASIGTDPVTGATIETNQDDYMPGEIVHVDGRGWAPNETVNLFMSEDPDTHEDVSLDVQADSTGAFSVHFYDVQEYDVGVTFTMTATGSTSGSKATTTFTDGNISFTTSPANLVTSITYSRFNGSGSCSGSPNSTGNTLSYNTGLGLNADQSILVTVPVVAGYTFSGYTGGSLTITPPTPTTLCVSGFGGGTQLGFVLNYTASAQNTNTAVASNTTPSVTGQAVTFTATITAGGNPVTTGNVAFKIGGTTCSDAPTTIGSAALNGSGQATSAAHAFNATETGAIVRACFDGATGFNASEGSTTQTVNKANTSTSLSDSPTSSTVGQTVTFTPTVTATAPGAGTPTGTVTVYEFTTGNCTAPGGDGALGSGAPGTGINISSLTAGNHTITACYSGDDDFNASSGTDTHSVSLIVTTTEIASDANPSVAGQTVTFTATVKNGVNPIGAQGNVAFKLGGTSCSNATTTLATVGLDGSGQAQTSHAFLATDSPQSVRACYAGNTSYASSEGSLTQTINKASTTTTLGSSPNPSTYGQTVTFTATVAPVSPGSGTPTGSVSFRKFASGSCASPDGLLLGSAALSGGTASVTFNALAVGSPQITACYAGDANYNASNGAATHTVNRALVTITASSASKVFGTTYVVTPSYGGFVLGQNESVLTTAPTCSSLGSPAGAPVSGNPYSTHCEGAAADNYTFAYVEGVLTITPATTTLTLAAPASTQYSDKVKLSASVSPTSLAGSTQAGSVEFSIGGSSVGSAALSGGTATLIVSNTRAAGSYNVTAAFTSSNPNFGDDSDGPQALVITQENASIIPDAANVSAINVSQTSFQLKFALKETNPEPNPNPDPDSRAAPGDISLANFSAKITGISTNMQYTGSCTSTTSGSGYAAVKSFTCTFSDAQFVVDAYTLELTVSGSYYTGADEDALTIYDPAAGFVTGGGKVVLNGDRVSFGLSFTYGGKGKTSVRGGLVVVRHHADGRRCRVKSNSMDAPAVSGTTASLSGKGNYTCVDANGVTTASAGNQTVLGYVEDNGTSGGGQDKFWIRAYGELMMTLQAPANALLLTGGNIQVPQPSR